MKGAGPSPQLAGAFLIWQRPLAFSRAIRLATLTPTGTEIWKKRCRDAGVVLSFVMTDRAKKPITIKSALAKADRLIDGQSALASRIAAKGDMRLLQQAWHTLSLLESARKYMAQHRQRLIAGRLDRPNWRP